MGRAKLVHKIFRFDRFKLKKVTNFLREYADEVGSTGTRSIFYLPEEITSMVKPNFSSMATLDLFYKTSERAQKSVDEITGRIGAEEVFSRDEGESLNYWKKIHKNNLKKGEDRLFSLLGKYFPIESDK